MPQCRRLTSFVGICLVFLGVVLDPIILPAQGTASVLAGIASALLDAAKNLDKIADGLDKLVAIGDKVGFPITEAKRIHNRLNDLLARSRGLQSANERFSNFGKELIAQGPTDAKWNEIQTQVSQILKSVRGLLADVEKERSDFVRSPIYDEFLRTFQGRVDLLTRLQTLPTPKTEAEIKDFKVLIANYDILIGSLKKANTAFAKYLDSEK